MQISPEVEQMMSLLDEQYKPLSVQQTEIQHHAELETRLVNLRRQQTKVISNLNYYRDLIVSQLIQNPALFGEGVKQQVETLITAILYREQPALFKSSSELAEQITKTLSELDA